MRMLIALFVAALATSPVAAQMSVTTFGATDARACYEDAFEGFARSTASCDAALRKGGLTQRDETATYVNRGVIYNRMGEPEAALADFDIALARDPGLGEAMINRGNSLYLKGDYSSAISEYERALETGTSKAHVAWFNIGLAEEARKRPDAAAAAYRKALEINPDFAMARDKL
jgi:tetratricopeptide (TPR) repeat protein